MSYRRKKIDSSRIVEVSSGYRLRVLEDATVSEISWGGSKVRFTGVEESLLEICLPEHFVDEASLGLVVRQALASRDGRLEITYTTNSKLRIPFDTYEAWSLRSEGTFHVVSVAGGGISIWI